MIDVGQGDAILINTPLNIKTILIDTGSKYNYTKLKKCLCEKGIYKIDYLIITHNDSDHNGNLLKLYNDFYIKKIIKKGEDINIFGFKLDYLYIDQFNNDNDNSLVYKLSINNLDFLFTGDISNKAERKLINKYADINVDVLKVSHHGSDTGSSEYFISNVLPKISIISTSGMYNHPSNKVLNILDRYLCKYYITKDDGSIDIYMSRLGNILTTKKGEFVIIK